MPEFVGFQTMGILVLYGITFDAVGVFGLAFHLLFKFCSTYFGYALKISNLNKLQDVQFVRWPIIVALNVKKETKKFMKWNASFMESACQFLMLLEWWLGLFTNFLNKMAGKISI